MLVFKTIKKLQQHLSSIPNDVFIGFVPTMGALHKGHLSLVEKAQKENTLVVASIFVNPTQFTNPKDLLTYPRTLKEDFSLLKKIGCDLLFNPDPEEIYGQNTTSMTFDFDGLENQMEGAFREGHFNGVGTIVKRLFEIVQPNNAYFGEKDFQQLQIIRKLVLKNNLGVNIHGCEIYRETDGLAMSSRNARLNKLQRKEVPLIYKMLEKVKSSFNQLPISEINLWVEEEFRKNSIVALEYFQIANEETLETSLSIESNKKYRAFIAVNVDDVRLIDNIAL